MSLAETREVRELGRHPTVLGYRTSIVRMAAFPSWIHRFVTSPSTKAAPVSVRINELISGISWTWPKDSHTDEGLELRAQGPAHTPAVR